MRGLYVDDVNGALNELIAAHEWKHSSLFRKRSSPDCLFPSVRYVCERGVCA
jgi:hypothetical protein